MKTMKRNNIPEAGLKNTFDILCQEFDGGNFYGLEYILDDFFQSTKKAPSDPIQQSIDWFGLNSQPEQKEAIFSPNLQHIEVSYIVS